MKDSDLFICVILGSNPIMYRAEGQQEYLDLIMCTLVNISIESKLLDEEISLIGIDFDCAIIEVFICTESDYIALGSPDINTIVTLNKSDKRFRNFLYEVKVTKNHGTIESKFYGKVFNSEECEKVHD